MRLKSDNDMPLTVSLPLRSTLVAVGAGLLLLAGCTDKKPAVKTVAPLEVTVLSAQPSEESLWLESLGRAEGAEEISIQAQVTGTLEKIGYREGESVKKGQVLFVIDQDPYIAALESAKATVRQRSSELKQADREARRYAQLWAAKAVSRKEYDDAASAADIARASLRQAKAAQKDAEINLAYTTVTAPSDGTAGRSLVNLGALVTSGTTQLATLSQPERLRVTFTLSERDIEQSRITLNNPVRLFDPYGKEIEGKLDYVSREINPETATRTLRARILSKTDVLPGQYVHVQLEREKLKNVFRIPQQAVLQRPDGTYRVYVNVNGKALSRDVTVGTWKETDWIVLTGLKAGDEVILDNLQRIKEGSPVKATVTQPVRTEAKIPYGIRINHSDIDKL